MYLFGQYAAFFKADWDFLKLITEKLFDFMSENSNGISVRIT